MQVQNEFEALRRETTSWWYIARRKLLRDAVAQALRGRREGRVLDLGCSAELTFDNPQFRATNAHSSLAALAFYQLQNRRNLICTAPEELSFTSNSFDAMVCSLSPETMASNELELSFTSNSFDAIVSGDRLQTATDDLAVLRELRRVLKDGATLCLTVPAYPALWGEKDETRGHRRRYTASELRRKLNNSGFDVTRVSYLVASGFVPAFIERVGKNIFTKSIEHDRTAPAHRQWLNAGMVAVVDCERFLTRYINLPFGTRLVCWARKPAVVAERVTVPAWERQWARNPLPQGM